MSRKTNKTLPIGRVDGVIELSADRYGWAAGAQWEVLNRLFWSKLSAAGRCWCGGTLLPYKLSKTSY